VEVNVWYPSNFSEDDPRYGLALSQEPDVEVTERGYGAWIYAGQHPDVGYVVRVTDYVANEWRTLHDTLSSALAYLALIQYCEEREAGLTSDDQVRDAVRELFTRATVGAVE
jgi:hypothetical protein